MPESIAFKENIKIDDEIDGTIAKHVSHNT